MADPREHNDVVPFDENDEVYDPEYSEPEQNADMLEQVRGESELSKQKKFKKNFEYVAQKIKEVEEKDQIRNFQPPISGEEIMELFNLKPGREIGILKEKVKEAILEGEISNDKEEARQFVINEGKKLNLA